MAKLWLSYIKKGGKRYFVDMAKNTVIMGSSYRKMAGLDLDINKYEIEYLKGDIVPESWLNAEELQPRVRS